jgi:putative DNA methylase
MANIEPRVLIEDWLPVAELGIESRRESAPIPGQFPKLKTLHVWWARRPLVAAAAVVLGGLLPAWSEDLAAAFAGHPQLETADAYRRWTLRLIGIWGDPIAARRRIADATEQGMTLGAAAYGYKPAFKNQPDDAEICLLHNVLRRAWQTDDLPLVADPTAGGGSIPFASARLGLPTYANDLNGVAASMLRAGVAIPAMYGLDLLPHLRKYGGIWLDRVRQRLSPFFPYQAGENYVTYIWANAVRCPRTGGLVPLITDQWLRKDKGKEIALRVVVRDDAGALLTTPRFEIIGGEDIDFNPSTGLMTGGTARSPYDDLAIDGEYIKCEAQAGRFEQVLYAVYYRKADGTKGYRAPAAIDLEGLEAAEKYLQENRGKWEASGCLPTDEIPEVSNYDRGHRMYGIYKWADMFTSRQLVTHAVIAEEIQRQIGEVRGALGQDLGSAVLTVLAFTQAKALNYNAKSISWNINRQSIRSVFEKHNFTFRWTFAEFQGSHELPKFAISQIIEAYEQLAGLLGHTAPDSLMPVKVATPVCVRQGNAADLSDVVDGSVTHLCMDPPYYDNVMYAELSDFFYVWEKGTLGRLLPDYFRGIEADKADEAIANPARFAATGRRKQELANADYQAKMTAIFTECHRVLHDNGVMTVMFTHKKADAWDALGYAIISAGFTIEGSWPVNTEPEASSHQHGKNAANSTIILVCRKREERADGRTVFLEDIEPEIRSAAREAALRFQHDGIDGVDLLLSTYGPTLAVASRNWPVYSSIPDESGHEQLLRPDEALDLARQEVVRLRRARLVGKVAQIDDVTDFALLAWDIFGAREFPFDTARLLALAVGGLDIDTLTQARILKKGSGTVTLLTPQDRLRRGASAHLLGVKPEATSFDQVIDAVDTVLYLAAEDGMPAAKRFMDRLGLTTDAAFLATVQGLVNAIPRSKAKGQWIVPEAGLLDTLATLYLPSIEFPADELEVESAEQNGLF